MKLKDIALAAGVSEGTASLALNNRVGVNEETKKKVYQIARDMGYVPSTNAKSLAEKKSGIIGVLVPNITNLFYSTLVSKIENSLRRLGYKMIFATTESNKEYEEEMINRFVSFRVEGAIIYPSIRENLHPDYLDLLKKNNIPMVFVGSYYEGVDAPHVMSDIYGGIYNAVDYMYQTGCRNFCYFGGSKKIVSNQLKLNAIRDMLATKGIIFLEKQYIELEKINYEEAYKAINCLLNETQKIDGILAGDAYSSLAIYNSLIQHGIKVPEEVSIISFDNFIIPEICVTKLSCIEQNIDEIVRKSLEVLLQNVNKEVEKNNYLIDTKLIIRDTTK